MRPLGQRKATWAVWLWTGAFAGLIGVQLAGRASKGCTAGDRLCRFLGDPEVRHGLERWFLLWCAGFIVLALVWLATRPALNRCPRCAESLPSRRTACLLCGYDSAIAIPLAHKPVEVVPLTPTAPAPRLEVWEPGAPASRPAQLGLLRAPRQARPAYEKPSAPS
jgi:hypothetical protein